MATSTRKRTRPRPQPQTPPSNPPTTPSKRVTLSVKVNDTDLDEGRFRTPRTISPTSTIATTTTVARTVQRRRRGRPKRLNFDLNTDADLDVVPIDFAAWEERHNEREEEFMPPDLGMFKVMSVLSFPVRMIRSQEVVDAGSRGQIQDQTPKQTGETQPPPSQSCAACGVPASSVFPHGYLVTPPSDQDHTSSAQKSPPWSHMFPTRRHVDVETGAVTDLVVLRSGPLPQTVEFWYDLMVGEMAMGTDDVDFKMLCLNLMRWRRENEVDEGLVRAVLGGGGGCGLMRDGGSGVRYTTVWDDVLVDAVVKGKIWRKRRRWTEKEREKAAGWAVWEMRERKHERGDFVANSRGAWVLKELGVQNSVRRRLKLGYKRLRKDKEFEANTSAVLNRPGEYDASGQDQHRGLVAHEDVAMCDTFDSNGS